jgi:hypothetical protein
MEHWPETSTNYETEEGARGSDAARQSNCHRVARERGLRRAEEKSAKNLRPKTCEPAVGSTGKKFALAECEPNRALARRAERSIEVDSSFEGQCLPFSNANFESDALAVAQLRHGSARACPAAISHSTGNNETKATFTRSITFTALTTQRSHRSFRINVLALSFANSSMTARDPAITNLLPICTQLRKTLRLPQPKNFLYEFSSNLRS